MKKTLLVSSLLGGLIVCLAAAPALAQDSTPPPAAPMSPPPAAASSSSSMGGGAIGVGAVTWLGSAANPLGVTTSTPIAGGEFVYDMPVFHLEGVFGFDHASNNGASATDVRFGVAGWYHLARRSHLRIGHGSGKLGHGLHARTRSRGPCLPEPELRPLGARRVRHHLRRQQRADRLLAGRPDHRDVRLHLLLPVACTTGGEPDRQSRRRPPSGSIQGERTAHRRARQRPTFAAIMDQG
jgi:hypothetical protein